MKNTCWSIHIYWLMDELTRCLSSTHQTGICETVALSNQPSVKVFNLKYKGINRLCFVPLLICTSDQRVPPFLSPDQRDPNHFCPVWVGDLASQQWQTGLAVCDTNWRRQTTWSETTRLTQSNPKIEEEPRVQLPVTGFHLQNFSPTKKKESPAHITVCKKCVASEQSETSQSPPTVCGNCLVPKLNWRMHCNSNCFCLSVSFFLLFIMVMSYKVYV